MSLSIDLRDVDRNRIGEIDDYQSLEAVLRFNNTSTWVLNLSPDLPLLSNIDFKNDEEFHHGIIVRYNDQVLFSGPITRSNHKREGSQETLILSGVDDSVWLDRRQAWPPLAWSANAYDSRTQPEETLMHQYVDANVGPSAATDRRVPGLILGTDNGNGPTLSVKARFPVVSDLLREISLQGDGLGFEIVQVGTSLEFQTYEPVDRSDTIQFSVDYGNLAGFDNDKEAAEANYFVVGGGGEGTARTFRQNGNSASIAKYGRIEQFVDRRDTTVNAELDQTITENITEKAEKRAISLSPTDTPNRTFGTHYGLGDTVAVITSLAIYEEVIREANFTATPENGVVVKPVVGTPGATDPAVPTQEKEDQRIIAKRLSNLERR